MSIAFKTKRKHLNEWYKAGKVAALENQMSTKPSDTQGKIFLITRLRSETYTKCLQGSLRSSLAILEK